MMSLVSYLCRTRSTSRAHPTHRRTRQDLHLESLEDRYMLSTFTVVNTSNAGAGSLRQAILNANSNPGADAIRFNIPGGGVRTIRPTAALPAINGPVTIDGTSQPGFVGSPLIELNGAGAGLNVSGLRINASNTAVQGLVINGLASGAGIYINGQNDVRVRGNYLGTNAAGTAGVPNKNGITVLCSIADPCSAHSLGGTEPGQRNVLSGNSQDGILITGATPKNNLAATIENNLIGTTADGAVALGNGRNGVTVSGPVYGVYVSGNVISANRSHGVQLTRGSAAQGPRDVTVSGNVIGYDSSYARPMGNFLDGVNAYGPTFLSFVYNNVIAHSGRDGVRVDGADSHVLVTSNLMEFNVASGIRNLNGGNGMTARPTITSATFDGDNVTVQGTVTAAPNTWVAVDVFSNYVCHPSGFGEGQLMMTQLTEQTDGSGRFSFTVTYPAFFPYWYVSATASPLVTIRDGQSTFEFYSDTSPFSSCLPVDGAPLGGPRLPDTGLLAALSDDARAPVAQLTRSDQAPLSAPVLQRATDQPGHEIVAVSVASRDAPSRTQAADLAFGSLGMEQPVEWVGWIA